MIVATDVDNTLGLTNQLIDDALIAKYGERDFDESDYWRERAFGIDKDEMAVLIREIIDEGKYLELKPIEGAAFQLRSLVGSGHRLIYISARADYYANIELAERELKQWLLSNGFPPGEIKIVSGTTDKVETAVKIGAELLIDDLPKAVEKAIQSGLKCFVHSRPWNADYRHTQAKKMDNWKHFPRLMLETFGAVI